MGDTNAKTNTPKVWLLASYLGFLTIVGLLLAYQPVSAYCKFFFESSQMFQEATQLVVLIVIMALCRSLPGPTRTGEGVDISSVAIFASFLAKGPGATVIILFISAFFTFDRQSNGKLIHVFNASVSKTLFNNFNLIISVVLGSYIFVFAGGTLSASPPPFFDLGLPQVLLPSLLYLVVSLLSDSIFMVLLFMILRKSPFFKTLAGGLRTMAPTLLALAPIGYFIAFVFSIKDSNGPYMALLFFVPLMFARYAFKLYLDFKEQYLRTISTLTAAIEAKDEYTEGHSRRVAQISEEIARSMGLRNSRIESIKVAAVLHDIGKIGIEDKILRKPSKLNEYEWSRIVEHPSIGIKILEGVSMPEVVKEMIQYHHVRYDGNGYPKIAKNKSLHIEVHIISLADAFDAMTSNRPYRKALTEEMALKIVGQERGTQFHPDVVDAFLKTNKKR